jgi:hypothetical protein
MRGAASIRLRAGYHSDPQEHLSRTSTIVEVVDLGTFAHRDYCEWVDPNENPYPWGDWKLRLTNLTLWHPQYEIDLEAGCHTSAGVLDWICQIEGKIWADDANLAGLVRAFSSILNPQRHLCSFGQPKRIDSVPDLVNNYVDRHLGHGCDHLWIYQECNRP